MQFNGKLSITSEIMATILVKQGDCLSNIAHRHGFHWETLWNHSQNSGLKRDRQDPNVLMPGDELFVPEKTEKIENGATENKHRFRALGTPAKIKIRMLIDNQARSNVSYSFYVDGVLISEGKTTGDGFVDATIPPNAAMGKIVITDDQGNKEEYSFDFGTVDPLNSEEGIRGRLFNLGYGTGELTEAIRAFQQEHSLEATGSTDDTTKNKLKEIFGE